MKILATLITNMETAIEHGDKDLSQVLSDLLQIAQGFDSQETALKAARKDNERLDIFVEKQNRKLDEYQSSCDALNRTISEQSQTLENRQKLLDEANNTVEAARLSIEAREKAMLEAVVSNTITPQHFADALDIYSLAVGRISSTDAHPQIVVALIQMAMHIRGLNSIDDIITWLRGSQ